MKKIIFLFLLCMTCIFSVNAQFTVQRAFSRIDFSSLPYTFYKDCSFDEYFTVENPNNIIPDKLYLNFQLTEYHLARDYPEAMGTLSKKFNLGNDVYLGLVDFGGALEWQTFSLITANSAGSIIDTLEVSVMSGWIMPKQFKITENREVIVYRLVPTSSTSIRMSNFRYVDAYITETVYQIDMAGQFIKMSEKRTPNSRTYTRDELNDKKTNLWDWFNVKY